MRHIQRKVSVDICKSQTVLLNAVHDRASNSFPQIRWNQMICKRKGLIGELYTKNTSRQYVNTYLLGKWKIKWLILPAKSQQMWYFEKMITDWKDL